MLTEVLVKGAVEAVVGQGFKAIVERIFRQEHGKTDRQILEAVLLEVHRHGGAIGNIEMRLVQLEQEISKMKNSTPLMQNSTPFVAHQPVSSLPAVAPQYSGYEAGAHFRRVSGGYMNFYNRSRKK